MTGKSNYLKLVTNNRIRRLSPSTRGLRGGKNALGVENLNQALNKLMNPGYVRII